MLVMELEMEKMVKMRCIINMSHDITPWATMFYMTPTFEKIGVPCAPWCTTEVHDAQRMSHNSTQTDTQTGPILLPRPLT